MKKNNMIVLESDSIGSFSIDSSKSGKKVLGKIKAPFFSKIHSTRNKTNYSRCTESLLSDPRFKEKMESRTFFGRLGHPMTEDEQMEDAAVRACVVLNDVIFDSATQSYSGIFDILCNKYGEQLKSEIDAGCILGVSTRCSVLDESKIISDPATGAETFLPGALTFDGIDVVATPSLEEARITVLESLKVNKESIIESINNSHKNKNINEVRNNAFGEDNKVMTPELVYESLVDEFSELSDRVALESLESSIKASILDNKDNLLQRLRSKNMKTESIIDTNNAGATETIKALANDNTKLAEKLLVAENLVKEYKKKYGIITEAEDIDITTFDTEENNGENGSEEVSVGTTEETTETIDDETESPETKTEDTDNSQQKRIELFTILLKSNKDYKDKLNAANVEKDEEIKKAEELSTDNDLATQECLKLNSKLQVAEAKAEKLFTKHKEVVESLKKQFNTKVSTLNKNIDKLTNQVNEANKKAESLKKLAVESISTTYGIDSAELGYHVQESYDYNRIVAEAKSIRSLQDSRSFMTGGFKLESFGTIVDKDETVDNIQRLEDESYENEVGFRLTKLVK